MKDKDGNKAVTHYLKDEDPLRRTRHLVAIHAEGVWFTPSQAKRFAGQILRAAKAASIGRYK
jgi:hypothetical protein